MMSNPADNWKPADLGSLVAAVIAAVENGDIDLAFENGQVTAGHLVRAKNTKNFTKNYLIACLKAGIFGISEARTDTALGLVNAYRRMNAEAPLEKLPNDYRVFAIKLPHASGNPDVEIYIKKGNTVLFGEKVLPRGILTENFLSVTGANPN